MLKKKIQNDNKTVERQFWLLESQNRWLDYEVLRRKDLGETNCNKSVLVREILGEFIKGKERTK